MRIVGALILSVVAWVATAQEKRLALIIGNSRYQSNAVLKNPVNDARAMDSVLQTLGFTTLRYENLGLNELKKAIDHFGARLPEYDVGLFYYAGHGIQYKGHNYLIPVDADLHIAQQVEFDCVPADRVLAFMENSGTGVNLLILDACRNNPFESSWNRSVIGSGLAFMNAPSGSLIAYATAPGSVASDGTQGNGLYTRSLLHHITVPNLTVEQVFKRVRAEIETITNKQQIPWESTSLKGDFYFNRDSTLGFAESFTGTPVAAAPTRELHTKRRHAVRIQAEMPVQLGVGYELQLLKNLSVVVQAGKLSRPNSLMMLNLMGSLGNKRLEIMIKDTYRSGQVVEGGSNFHFGHNYVGAFAQYITMGGATGTATFESNFNTDLSVLPVKPGSTSTESSPIHLSTNLVQTGILYGRVLPLKNPDWQIRVEFSLSKNVASTSTIYSSRYDLSSLERYVNGQLDSWFNRYAYIPSLTVSMNYLLGGKVN
jgi:hypothetical protein